MIKGMHIYAHKTKDIISRKIYKLMSDKSLNERQMPWIINGTKQSLQFTKEVNVRTVYIDSNNGI